MFDAFGKAVATNPALVLHLLGSVSPTNAALARAEIPETNLRMEGFVPHDMALQRMADADVLVVISSVSESGAGTLTGKIFECLAVGRPIVLLASGGPAADLIERCDAGFAVSPTDVNGVTSAILEMADRAAAYVPPGPAVLAPYDRERQARRWSDLLESTSIVDATRD